MKERATGSQSEVRKATSKPSGKIVKKVWIRASTKVVYDALTEARELIHWFCDRAACDPREGGELIASWRAGKTSQKGRAVFTRIVPRTAVELLWTEEGNHTLGYEIRSKGDSTELIMTDQDDSASDAESISILDQGWNLVLTELRDHCERKERLSKLRPHAKTKSQSIAE
jgi:uncharacterized protein YndB with AHSA1/START domain